MDPILGSVLSETNHQRHTHSSGNFRKALSNNAVWLHLFAAISFECLLVVSLMTDQHWIRWRTGAQGHQAKTDQYLCGHTKSLVMSQWSQCPVCVTMMASKTVCHRGTVLLNGLPQINAFKVALLWDSLVIGNLYAIMIVAMPWCQTHARLSAEPACWPDSDYWQYWIT